VELKLTRFRGHLILSKEGVRDAQDQAAVSRGVQAADCRIGDDWSLASRACAAAPAPGWPGSPTKARQILGVVNAAVASVAAPDLFDSAYRIASNVTCLDYLCAVFERKVGDAVRELEARWGPRRPGAHADLIADIPKTMGDQRMRSDSNDAVR
jgi:hypothetical protein